MRFAHATQVVGKLLAASLLLFFLWAARCPPWQWLRDLRPLGINPDGFCLFDRVQHDLQEENLAIRHNTGLAYTLQLLSSLMIDLSFLNSCVAWISSCDTGRLYWAILIFYTTRALVQVDSLQQDVFLFRFPVGSRWDVPFIPSLMVPYGLTSDFYFSGHCGFIVLNLLETYHQEKARLKAALMGFFLCYLMFILVLFRVHYSIGRRPSPDLPIGILFALLVYREVALRCRALDRFASRHIYFGVLARLLPSLQRRSASARPHRVESSTDRPITLPLTRNEIV